MRGSPRTLAGTTIAHRHADVRAARDVVATGTRSTPAPLRASSSTWDAPMQDCGCGQHPDGTGDLPLHRPRRLDSVVGGGERRVPDLPDLAGRLVSKLGRERFDEYASSGATMDLAEASHYVREQVLLARAQWATRSTRPGHPGDLGVREVDVSRLVAEGLTTRAIANRLYVSAKTADHHIQHVYTKIGVSNRAAPRAGPCRTT